VVRKLREKYGEGKVIAIDDSDAVLEYLGKEGEIETMDAKTITEEERKRNVNTL